MALTPSASADWLVAHALDPATGWRSRPCSGAASRTRTRRPSARSRRREDERQPRAAAAPTRRRSPVFRSDEPSPIVSCAQCSAGRSCTTARSAHPATNSLSRAAPLHSGSLAVSWSRSTLLSSLTELDARLVAAPVHVLALGAPFWLASRYLRRQAEGQHAERRHPSAEQDSARTDHRLRTAMPNVRASRPAGNAAHWRLRQGQLGPSEEDGRAALQGGSVTAPLGLAATEYRAKLL